MTLPAEIDGFGDWNRHSRTILIAAAAEMDANDLGPTTIVMRLEGACHNEDDIMISDSAIMTCLLTSEEAIHLAEALLCSVAKMREMQDE